VRYVALLRGINVGGHAKLPMADLRALLTSLGHSDVTTYLQSGNALFSSERESPSELAREIEAGIERDLTLRIPVLIRTHDELAAVIAENPFPAGAQNPTRLHVGFLSKPVLPEQLNGIDAQRYAPDEFKVGDRAIYLWYPNGAGRTKLTANVWERHLGGVIATARNWNTVTTLKSLMEA
jgi:uncharacterized protein (DUF1697 family)